MSEIFECCGCCVLCCACFSICGRLCLYMPWGKKHKTPEDPEDEAYAADVERQMQVEREHEERQTHTQLQPQALPNPYDKAQVKDNQGQGT